jgi:hypothetical protein
VRCAEQGDVEARLGRLSHTFLGQLECNSIKLGSEEAEMMRL